jgi:chitin disaccharide deacetylase
MKHLLVLFTAVTLSNLLYAQSTIQERLGYSKNTKLLIIHGDDLGVSHSENKATQHGLEKGSITSASIMVPTPWFAEIAAYANANPKADFGLHLTLTSEWKYYKWGPVTGRTAVPGLVNEKGYFYETTDSVYKTASVQEVEKEIRAQIEKALKAGIDVTHLDSHMGTLYSNPDYFEVMVKLGKEYKIPIMRMKPAIGSDERDIYVDRIYGAGPGDFKKGMAEFYANTLKSVQPGLSLIIIHAAYDNEEMQAVTVDRTDWGAAWRQADHDFFTSEQCRTLLREQNIQLITWREIRDKLLR